MLHFTFWGKVQPRTWKIIVLLGLITSVNAQTDSLNIDISQNFYPALGQRIATVTVLLHSHGCGCVHDKSVEFYTLVRDTIAQDQAMRRHFDIQVYDFDSNFEMVDSLLEQGTDYFMPVIQITQPDGYLILEMAYDLDRTQLFSVIRLLLESAEVKRRE